MGQVSEDQMKVSFRSHISPSPVEILIAQEVEVEENEEIGVQKESVTRELDSLDLRSKAIVELCLANYSYIEIAEFFDIAEAHARQIFHRAKRKIRRQLF